MSTGLDAEYTYVCVTLTCGVCNGSIGEIYRLAGQHPRAGTEMVQRECGELRDRTDGGWVLHSVCPTCRTGGQTDWEQIAAVLDELRHDATPFGVVVARTVEV